LAHSPKQVTWLSGASALGAAATIEGLPHAWVTVETVLSIAAIVGYVLLADRANVRWPAIRSASHSRQPERPEEPRPDMATATSH